MQKLLNKITASLATLILVATNFIPAFVYAGESLRQDAKTTEENVEFNASINNEYTTTLNVDEGGELILNLKVSGTGYLKDSTVTIENNNYEIIDNGNLDVKSIKDNVIELDEVNAGEILNVSLPIKLNKESKVKQDILGRDSSVTLNAIYVNKSGKERKIKKTLTEHVDWTSELNEVVSQSLIRYIKYDDNKTMVSFKIEEGIKDNKMPVTDKEIVIGVPTLNDSKPENVIVTGTNISYSYENDVLTIKKQNKADSDGKIFWDSQDEYIVTYIYGNQVEEATIQSGVVAKSTVKGSAVEGTIENNTYELKDQVGSYVEANVYATEEINKGYMYTNLKDTDNALETPFKVTYKANVGYKELTDSVKIVEKSTMFDSLEANDSILNKKVRINKDNLVEILGEDGSIKVLSEDGTELGVLSKDKLELDVNVSKVIIETSKVVKEGTLEVEVSKVITANNSYTKDQIASLAELISNVSVEGYKEETLNSSKDVSSISKFTEPTSNANVDINVQNLSTVVKNENVIITATLETKDINDALYSNAKVDITLPEEVKDINIKEARLIYEDELKLNNLVSEGNKISFNLDGTQTKYSTQATSDGTVVRLVTDITLDNLAPTSEKTVTLDYSNEATGEQRSVNDTVGISAPTGFVTTNSLEVDGNKITSQESNEQIIKVDASSSEKDATISGTIVNNLGYEATGLTILGRIPTSGNKDENEVDLGSNFDTILNSAIQLEGADAEIYYSENVNESVNGEGWSNTYTQNAKSYKLVFSGTIPHGTVINFSYIVKVPANLENGKTSKSTYAVYYNNNAEEGSKQNIVLAKAVGIATEEKPLILAEVKMIDTNTSEEIADGSDVKEGKKFLYKLIVKNTGKETARNTKVNISIPNGIALLEKVTDMTDLPTYQYNNETKALNAVIDEIEAGKEKELDYNLVVTQIITGVEGESTEQKIVANITNTDQEQTVSKETTIKVVKGDIVASATSDKTDNKLRKGDSLEYYLEIKNANYETKNNILAKIVIPKEFKVNEVYNNSGTSYDYDNKSNTITYKEEVLESGETNGIYVILEVGDIDANKKVSIKSTVKCDEMEKEENVESINYNLIKDVISATLSSNIEQNNLSDTDELEYNINVENNSSETITVNVSDTIPDGLRVVKYKVKDATGEKEIETSSRSILEALEINPSETSRLTIVTRPYLLQSGRILKIENKATISFEDIVVETNTLKHTIVGTSQNSAGSSTEPEVGESGTGSEDFEDEKTEEGTYKISGQVWVDENADGKKDENEEKLSGITVKLFDKASGQLSLDVNGKEQQKTTNESGKYTFTNIVPGEYIVVIEYDNLNYDLTDYKVDGLLDSENSDFVSAKLNEKTVAATDKIKVENANTYNIDLGLVKGKTFDLDITKVISRVTVTNTKADTRVYNYNDLSVAKVELATSNVNFATVLVEYTIRIQNNGRVAGYAKSIVDYIPEGMTFNSELNNTWYLGKDGNAYNTNLANTIINPGETKELKLVLSRKMSGENTGTVRNTAEILISYNEYGLVDKDVQSDNNDKVTEDKSAADLVIAMATGREIASFTGITLGILSLIALAVYEIKKHIINKMYNII